MPRETFISHINNAPSGFSPCAKAGNLVFTAGQVSVDSQGNLVGEGDAKEQARQCFKNIKDALEVAGASMSDIVKVTTFLVNVEYYNDYAEIRLGLFPSKGPASSTVIIKELVRPEFLIEIEAIAVIN